MLAKRIIACLDVMDGRTVKGVNFSGLRDAGDPVELAARYSAEGADELVFLDITASARRQRTMPVWVERVARAVNIPFTVGGGISSERDVEELLRRGADKVSVNSAVLADPSLIDRLARAFGRQCIVLAVDARRENGLWQVYAKGGRERTGRELLEWVAEAERRGCGEVLFTSMDHDGVRGGFACEALASVARSVRVPLIASGGAGEPSHFHDVFVRGRADAALAAGILHDGAATIGEIKRYLKNKGLEIR